MLIVEASIIKFESLDKEKWIDVISRVRRNYTESLFDKKIGLEFNSELKSDKFEPVHLVMLASLIHFFDQKGHKVVLVDGNASVHDMLFKDLRFSEYWLGGKNHVDCADDSIFNLWRIVETEKDLYAKNTEKYFKNNFFKEKDLSVISLSMIEAYYNVFDHADADGNAFSLIMYDSVKEVLHVAICDFGKGIAKSVRDFDPSISSDKEALMKSIELDFTVGSKEHNRGKGLDNILSCSSVIRICCNDALLIKIGSQIKAFDTGYHFGGTLIYFEIQLSLAENEEILNEFDLF